MIGKPGIRRGRRSISIDRHAGMECRHPGCMDAILGDWIPAFPAGMTNYTICREIRIMIAVRG
jgi:hypothetical protein